MGTCDSSQWNAAALISDYVIVTPCKFLITAPISSTSGAYYIWLYVVDHCVLCWAGGLISFGLLPGLGMAKSIPSYSSTAHGIGECGRGGTLAGDFQGVV